MKNFRSSLVHFFIDEDGMTAVEYALLVALVILLCMVSILACGDGVGRLLSQIMARMADS
jgi:Flp pilus assembly pilin Flp